MESCGFWIDDALQSQSVTSYATSVNFIIRTKILERYVPFLDMTWILGKTDPTSLKDALFDDLMEECEEHWVLSYLLRERLERLTAAERKELVSRVKDGCSPLFVACLHGHFQILDYLVKVCGADTEQRGLYGGPDDDSVHCVTALWVAAVQGKLSVLQQLVELGADVNAASDSGSTPVRSACYMDCPDIVEYLVDHGADIHKTNVNRGTCLINSIDSAKLCQYLLSHGAAVNHVDNQNKTALHYAIEEGRLDSTQVLLDWGANPFIRSRQNDDALQTACLRGEPDILEYLSEVVMYPPERLADAHELMGATLMDQYHDPTPVLYHWRKALEIRRNHGKNGVPLPKLPVMTPKATFDYATEFTTLEELRNVSDDIDALSIQGLLICERIIGEQHTDTLFRMMLQGASYADQRCYQSCINLWKRVLEIRFNRYTVVASETYYTTRTVVNLFIHLNVPSGLGFYEDLPFNDDLHYNHDLYYNDPGDDQLPFQELADVFEMLAKAIVSAEKLLEIRPVSERQQEFYNRNYNCLFDLMNLIVYTSKTEEDKETTRRLLTNLLRSNPREAFSGNTLLHKCIIRLELRDPCPVDTTLIDLQLKVLSELLRHGAPVNAENCIKSTPLLVAANTDSISDSVLQLLLDHGAHLDQRNNRGQSALQIIRSKGRCSVPLMNYLPLRCLAASAVLRYNIPYEGKVPRSLESFVQIH